MTRVEGWWYWSHSNGFLEADAAILQTTAGNRSATITIYPCLKEGRVTAYLQGVPWNQKPSRTGCFSPQVCQETVLWDMPLWWHRKESKSSFCFWLPQCCLKTSSRVILFSGDFGREVVNGYVLLKSPVFSQNLWHRTIHIIVEATIHYCWLNSLSLRLQQRVSSLFITLTYVIWFVFLFLDHYSCQYSIHP